MAKLNQIIAVVKGKKSRAQKELTEIYKRLQKPPLFEGISRTYQPVDEDGETQPPELKNIQYKAKDAMREAREALTELFDITATQDWANREASADIQVDDQTILESVPITQLIFLEKQLADLHTFVSQIPTLDASEKWHWDGNSDCYAAETTFSNRTKKIPLSHILVEATEHHPAQAEMYHEDVKVGEWRTVKFSAALPAQERNEILARIRKLQDATKFAREQANQLDVNDVKIGNRVFDFVFGAQT